jgi:hypothetical protein
VITGPLPFHGKMLLDVIRAIDHHIEESVETGAYPVLDAVTMSRVLKALVRGDREYILDEDQARRRIARIRELSATVAAPTTSWHSTKRPDDDDPEGT